MKNDRQIHPLSTTDQINNIDEVGITNFFKAYRQTKETLSGDFYIGTKLMFTELKTIRTSPHGFICMAVMFFSIAVRHLTLFVLVF
jgi:hypothetical protein